MPQAQPLLDPEERDAALIDSQNPATSHESLNARPDSLIEGDESAGLLHSERQRLRRRHHKLIVGILIASFVGLIFFVAILTGPIYWGPAKPQYSNGTDYFDPTVILISFDGLRADYLDRGNTPIFSQMAYNGVRAQYLRPSFPSVTFANHYTLVTGLYPESHGIVGNTFYDPDLDEAFNYKKPGASWDAKWWGGEPIWTTAVKQGVRSAIHMWPGSSSDIAGARPTYYDTYDGSWSLSQKTDRILGWLDMDVKERPGLIGAYVPDVDMAGHEFGPDSPEVSKSLDRINAMMTDLMRGLHERNLTDIVNIIVVSDHGMTRVNEGKKIAYEDILDKKDVRFVHGYPLGGIWPKEGVDTAAMYGRIRNASHGRPFSVYHRDEVPERFHYRSSDRIAPLLCIPDVGFYLSWKNDTSVPGGMHGYDNEAFDMRASLVAQGPAIRKGGGDLGPPVNNIEVYGLVSHILGLAPSQNNGTIQWEAEGGGGFISHR